jgi:hypothetical protein
MDKLQKFCSDFQKRIKDEENDSINYVEDMKNIMLNHITDEKDQMTLKIIAGTWYSIDSFIYEINMELTELQDKNNFFVNSNLEAISNTLFYSTLDEDDADTFDYMIFPKSEEKNEHHDLHRKDRSFTIDASKLKKSIEKGVNTFNEELQGTPQGDIILNKTMKKFKKLLTSSLQSMKTK